MLEGRFLWINEIGQIAERVGADIEQVRSGIGADPRIGYDALYPGCGMADTVFQKTYKRYNTSQEKHTTLLIF